MKFAVVGITVPISEDLGRPRRLLTSQFVTQSYQCRATNLVASEKRNFKKILCDLGPVYFMIIYGKW